MTPFFILTMIATALVFLMWAFSMFRALFAMRSRAVARTGKTMPGPIDALQEAALWLRDPAFKQERRQLFLMTAIVMLLSILMAFLNTSVP